MGKERLTELDKQFASMTKEQAKGIAMAISDMMNYKHSCLHKCGK